MKVLNILSILFMIIIYLINKIQGKILDDNVNTNINWIVLTKFYFHPTEGFLSVQLESNDENVKFFILNENQWHDDLSRICSENSLNLISNENQTNTWSLITSFTDINRMYLILSFCNSTRKNFQLTYKLTLTNGKNLFTEQFSSDERGILGLFISSTILYMLLLFLVLRSIYISKRNSCLIRKFSLISIFYSWLNSFLSLIYTLIFAFTGSNQIFIYQFCLFFSRLFDFLAQILFLLTLILCVKGYLIIRIHLEKQILIQIYILISIYTILQIIILIILTIIANQTISNENLYLTCNYLQMTMYLLSWSWFLISFIFTRQYSNKDFNSFLIFSIWFVINAIVYLLSNFDFLSNPRITILKTIQISIQFVSYCIFQLIIRKRTTKLNQINITYIDPSSKTSNSPPIISENETRELTDLYSVGNFGASIKSLGPRSRLEPRREICPNPTKSPTHRLAPLNERTF